MARHPTSEMTLDQAGVKAMSAANRERCDQLVELIRRKMADIRDSFFEIGEALAEIHNNALYRAAGHDSFTAFLLAMDLPGATQANKLIAVAELVEREDAVVLGQEKAYAITRFAEAVGSGKPIRALLRQRNLVAGKSAREASVRDLLEAARQAKAERRQPSALEERKQAAARTAREVQAALRRQGWEGVRVKARRVGAAFEFELVATEDLVRRLARL